MRRRVPAVLGGLVLTAGLAFVPGSVVPSAGVEADVSTELPIGELADMVVDPVHDRAFLSSTEDDGDPSNDVVVVVDPDGSVDRTIPVPYAGRMTLSPDGRAVYVTTAKRHGFVAIDSTDLSPRDLPVDSRTCPRAAAFSAGLLWYLQDCRGETEADPSLDAVDPVTGVVHRDLVTDVHDGDLLSRPDAAPGQLVYVGDSVQRVEVTGGDDPTASAHWVADATSDEAAALTPDGRRLVSAYGTVMDLGDGRFVDVYPTGDDEHRNASTVAVRADGAVALGGEEGPAQVVSYPPGQTVQAQRWSSVPSGAVGDDPVPARRGLGFGTDRLFVATAGHADGHVHLHVVEQDLAPGVTLGTDRLPFLGDGQVVADPRRGRAYVTGGGSDNGVAVVDHRGHVVTVLQHLPHPTAMALSPSGRTLYVALDTTDQVAAIDTSTYAVRRIQLPRPSCPTSLAWQAGLLWFTTHCASPTDVLSALDPASGEVTRTGVEAEDVRASPAASDLLVSAFTYGPSRIRVAGGAHPHAEVAGGRPTGYPADLAVTPDGLDLALVSPEQDRSALYSQSLLGPSAGAVPTDDPPVAVAVRGDGLVVAITGVGRSDVLASGGVTVPATYKRSVPVLHGTGPGALAFSRRSLFAVAEVDDAESRFVTDVVRVVPMPALRPLRITADGVLYVAGQTAHVAAHSGTASTAHRLVSVYARGYGQRRARLVAHRRLDAFGNVVVGVPVTTRTVFTATVAGTHVRETTARDVAVAFHDTVTAAPRDDPSEPASFDYRSRVTPAHAGHCVHLRVQESPQSDRWHSAGPLRCLRPDARGRIHTTVVESGDGPTRILRFRAEWGGGGGNVATVGPWHTEDLR